MLCSFFWILYILISPLFAQGRIAVLEFRGINISHDVLDLMTEIAREGVRKTLPPSFDVTDKETIPQILSDMGIKMEDCIDTCELTLGKSLSADYVITGEMRHLEGQFYLTIKLLDIEKSSSLVTENISDVTTTELFRKCKETTRQMMTNFVLASQYNRQKKVHARFTSIPSGETIVQVNGQLICTQTPCSEKVPEGIQSIRFSRKDYFPWTTTRSISDGDVITAELKYTLATISINTEPKDLSLLLDGQAFTKIENHTIEPGTHDILISDPCYVREGIQVHVEPNTNRSYTIKPHHKKSGIQVITSYEDSPIPAKVYVDNKFLGTTPLRTMIPLCAKELRVESKYYQKTQPLSPKEHRIHEFNIQPETLLIEDF